MLAEKYERIGESLLYNKDFSAMWAEKYERIGESLVCNKAILAMWAEKYDRIGESLQFNQGFWSNVNRETWTHSWEPTVQQRFVMLLKISLGTGMITDYNIYMYCVCAVV